MMSVRRYSARRGLEHPRPTLLYQTSDQSPIQPLYYLLLVYARVSSFNDAQPGPTAFLACEVPRHPSFGGDWAPDEHRFDEQTEMAAATHKVIEAA